MLQKIDEIDELYCNYKKKIYKHALSYVRDFYLAEDITQEVFMKYYYNRDKFAGQCSLNTWLYKLTKNHCIDYLRKNYKNKILLSEKLALSGVEERTPELELLFQGDSKNLKEMLNLLPNIYKEVLYLYYFRGYSIIDIHGELNLNISTIKTRLRRGKLLLSSIYKKEITNKV
ncbi:sigma-70 family RNA polymerase sigma factor [Bacillus salipaludis]|uniref:Sigma-70 family RNA polymerase sigma factor n=1 Tax=Bacillus salipaludis TaxID=2547811 RepID=A0A4R5VJV6_9BACI|nr:sigma-70 family RNA polymerase sigma factor [Bacillus salipaludis]TDK58169.1 sigma-70 family RNA polymerase sigma factor [Bacillus salipaludis]